MNALSSSNSICQGRRQVKQSGVDVSTPWQCPRYLLALLCRFVVGLYDLSYDESTTRFDGGWSSVVDRPQLVCEQVRYTARLHGGSGVTMHCLVRSKPPISASQAVFVWTTLDGRNESITAGQRDGHYFADLRPAVRFSSSP